jgi:acyl carrier protein
MNNLEKIENIFRQEFNLDSDFDLKTLSYQSVSEWDSVGHMSLVAALEDEFEIELEMDDIIDLSSFEVALQTLKKYGVE